MDSKSSDFLACFNQIEKHLRDVTDSPKEMDFSSVLRKCERGLLSKSQITELKRFASLRNLIAHEHSHTPPLAIPSDQSLAKIRNMAERLKNPETLHSIAKRPVQCGSPNDHVGHCIRLMHENDFSQLPIYDGKRFHGLLTADTILHWLARFFPKEGNGIVEEASIGDVMRMQLHEPHFKFMRRDNSAMAALTEFEKAQKAGGRLEAILVTEGGRREDSLLGIVTFHDIPSLIESVSGLAKNGQ
ncbi:MAG: CBS domain-containing protein [Pirellulaceae bacterium]|nr:CBS domain-containing protein [Pirellulaceae bacterium]